MGQLRVAKAVWDKLDPKAQEARKAVVNGVFLNQPVLDELTNEYVWDDHRLTEDHEFILEECKKLKPTKSDREVALLELMDEKVFARKQAREREPRLPVTVTEEQVSPELTPRPR